MRRNTWLPAVTILSTLTAAPAVAAPLYTIDFPTPPFVSSVASATPFRRDSIYALPPSNGAAQLSAGGFSGKGFVSAITRIDCVWYSFFSGANGASVWSRAQTNDFIITGPAGSFVTGTLNLRLRANLDKGGGFPTNAGHGAALQIDARVLRLDNATYAMTNGTFYSGNGGYTNGTGFLAGQTNPNLDLPVTVTGSFPVGFPFIVTLAIEASGATYGIDTYSPGFIEADDGGSYGDITGRGLMLEEVSGRVMTLPAGYTLNSASWGVVDNRFASPLAVGDAVPGSDLRLELAGANPASGTTRVALILPRDGRVRVTLFDLAGRAQRTLFDGWQPAGTHRIAWDGRTETGAAAPAGLYFIRAESGGNSATRAVVRVR